MIYGACIELKQLKEKKKLSIDRSWCGNDANEMVLYAKAARWITEIPEHTKRIHERKELRDVIGKL